MKKSLKYLFLFLVLFSVCLITVNAKTTKKTTAKSTKTTEKVETKEEDKKEETTTKEKKKVNLYLFRRSGCGYCAAEMQFLDTIVPDYKNKINIIVYNVSLSGNQQLLQDVADELKLSIRGVPFNLIGSETQEGYAEYLDETFKQMLDEAYENQPEDVVAKLIAKNNYPDLKSTTLYEAMDEEGLEYNSKPGSKAKKENLVFIIVFGSVIAALASLIYFSRKK